MIILGIEPLPGRGDLGTDLPVPPPLLLHLLRNLFGDLLLLLVVPKDRAAVLRARVAALAVLGRGVVHLVEELDEGRVGE